MVPANVYLADLFLRWSHPWAQGQVFEFPFRDRRILELIRSTPANEIGREDRRRRINGLHRIKDGEIDIGIIGEIVFKIGASDRPIKPEAI